MTTTEVVPYGPTGMPLVAPTPETAREAMQLYQEITRALLTSDDMQRIGRKEFPKRSAFQKLANAYRVSTEIVKDLSDYDGNGRLIRVQITVRATHPDGRTQDGDGRCHIEEKGRAADDPKSEHDVHGTAVTRAKNRAIGDLVAFGAVSAEEVGQAEPDGPPRPYGEVATRGEEDGLLRALEDLGAGVGPANRIVQRAGYLPKLCALSVMFVAADVMAKQADNGEVTTAPEAASEAASEGDTPADTEAE